MSAVTSIATARADFSAYATENDLLLYSWEEFTNDAAALALMIASTKTKIDGVYGLPRGGTVLAVYLSHALHVPFYQKPSANQNVLVVDDNVVTGNSLKPFVDGGFTTAALVHNPETSCITPTFYARTCTTWPLFPWEVDCSITDREGWV